MSLNFSSVKPLPELDLFSVPPIQNSIDRDLFTEHRPISILEPSSAITFVIPTALDEYIQLRESMLNIKLRVNISKADKSAVVASDWSKISPVKYWLHALFKQVDVEINGKPITSAPQTYAYKAMFETQLGFTDDARKSHLSVALWSENDTENKDTIDSKRSLFIKPNPIDAGNGKEVELMGKLHIDLAFQGRAIIGGSELKITLIPNSPQFYLQCDPSIIPSIQFLNASFLVHRSKITQPVVEAHNYALQSTTAKYPFTKTEVKAFNINTSTLSYNVDNVVAGTLPRRIFVAFVDNKAFNGSYEKNPFKFGHYNVNYISAYINGIQVNSRPFLPDFKKGLYAREYLGLFETLNQLTTDSVIPLSKDEWSNGNTIFGFNLAPDLSDGYMLTGHVNHSSQGTLRLEIRFAEALTETINVLVYCEYDSILHIDKNREAVVEYM